MFDSSLKGKLDYAIFVMFMDVSYWIKQSYSTIYLIKTENFAHIDHFTSS